MRWVAGFLLVCAGLLKAVELVTEPAVALSSPFGQYFLPVQIGVELAVGLLLLSGLYWRTLQWFVLALFTGFAGYSLYLAMHGAASCGCFGPVHINPWWTFALDSSVVVGLLIAIRRQRDGFDSNQAWTATPQIRRRVIAATTGLTVIAIALLIRYVDQRVALAEGALTSAGDLVILEPETWVGQRLPIADSIDIDLSHGDWVILLHRHDCPACQEQLPRYERRAASGERIAFVEVPPFGDATTRGVTAQQGRLRPDRDWFVQTPVELRLQAGIVTATHTHEH